MQSFVEDDGTRCGCFGRELHGRSEGNSDGRPVLKIGLRKSPNELELSMGTEWAGTLYPWSRQDERSYPKPPTFTAAWSLFNYSTFFRLAVAYKAQV